MITLSELNGCLILRNYSNTQQESMQRPATAIFTSASVVSWLLSSASYLSRTQQSNSHQSLWTCYCYHSWTT